MTKKPKNTTSEKTGAVQVFEHFVAPIRQTCLITITQIREVFGPIIQSKAFKDFHKKRRQMEGKNFPIEQAFEEYLCEKLKEYQRLNGIE